MKPRLEYKSFPTKFILHDDVPPDLVGTAWDPVMADGSPVQTSADFVIPSDAEIRKRVKAIELAEKRSQPIRIVTFEC
jgi:hypothetical protein